MNKFGKANLENDFEGFKYFKLRTPDPKKGEETTELVLRLLPAMHSYADSGEWKFFYAQHYGYFGNNPRNPEKPRTRPFSCVQKKNNKTKEILVACPKCDQIEARRAQYDKRKQEIEEANPGLGAKSQELLDIKRNDEKLNVLGKWLSSHNCDKKFWINVMSFQGDFGVLMLSYKSTMEVLLPLLKKLRDEDKVDAFDANGGIWLRFTRTGRNPNVTDRVEPFTELVEIGDGRKARVNKSAAMTQEQIEKALRICPDLKKNVNGTIKTVSVETIRALVNCSGEPDEVDHIWPQEVKTTATAVVASDDDGGHDEPTPDLSATTSTSSVVSSTRPVLPVAVAVAVAVAPAPAALSTTLVAASAVDQSEEELERQLSELRARKTHKKTESRGADVGAVEDFLANFKA